MFKKRDYSHIDDLGADLFECTPDNIKRVLDILDIKYAITDISAIRKERTFLNRIEALGLKYKIIPLRSRSYVRVLFMSSGDELKSLLAEILKFNDFAFISTDDKELCEKFFKEAQDIDKQLVYDRVFNMYFSVLSEEDMTIILVNKEIYDVEQKRLLLKEIEKSSFER